MNSIGICGFGRFGKVLYEQFKNYAEIKIYDPFIEKKYNPGKYPFRNLEQICQCQLIILAVPIAKIKNLINELKGLVKSDSIIMDVCAVKTYPIKLLLDNIPEDVEILGSHPLFGPDSVTTSLSGHTIILTPARISQQKLKRIKSFLAKFDLKIVEMSPDEQDRLMAWTLALTHFLGRSLNNLPLPNPNIATKDYQNLLRLIKKVNQDTYELFEDMHRFNPYTVEMRKSLLKSMKKLKKNLDVLEIN
jgi:prephenate dehydrogenase